MLFVLLLKLFVLLPELFDLLLKMFDLTGRSQLVLIQFGFQALVLLTKQFDQIRRVSLSLLLMLDLLDSKELFILLRELLRALASLDVLDRIGSVFLLGGVV